MIASARYKPRQIDEDALWAFLSRLAPVYMILFLGAILIAYFIVQSITRPLLRLKQEMADVNPLIQGLPLEYRWQDEIGGLVTQYNELLEKLRASLEERAKYEREGAWKEMAQQVAHEIKNPLTPLRLGIQQLEKAWIDEAPGFSSRIEKFSSTALAQIDILSSIAEDFALLAEVRTPNLKSVSISDIVSNAAGLYGTDKVVVEVENLNVLGDSENLIRVFNNLILNAIEATDESGSIDPVFIRSVSGSEHHVITVTDSGVGISEDQLSRIFEPRFTTKKHGLGLGLAMVKSIVEQANGEVTVKSIAGKGSVFSVKLLKGK
jgi:two-component system nitrogen regulation sensor histidine kinase NtrY